MYNLFWPFKRTRFRSHFRSQKRIDPQFGKRDLSDRGAPGVLQRIHCIYVRHSLLGCSSADSRGHSNAISAIYIEPKTEKVSRVALRAIAIDWCDRRNVDARWGCRLRQLRRWRRWRIPTTLMTLTHSAQTRKDKKSRKHWLPLLDSNR